MDDNQIVFVNAINIELEALVESMTNLGFPPVLGLKNLNNVIINGRSIKKPKEQFIKNLIKSFDGYNEPTPSGLSTIIRNTMKRSLNRLLYYTESIDVEFPIKYHADHLKLMQTTEVMKYHSQQTVATKRINELIEIGRPELALPALKDQLILVFEKPYKELYKLLKELLADILVDKTKINDCIEEIIAIEQVFTQKGVSKSDFRCIRNQFAHPDKLDCYDYYRIEFDDNSIMKMNADELGIITVAMLMKISVLQLLSRAMIDLRLYELEFEKN